MNRKTNIVGITKIYLITLLITTNNIFASDIFDKVNPQTSTVTNKVQSAATGLDNSQKKCTTTGRVIKCTGAGTITRDNSGNTLGEIYIPNVTINANTNNANAAGSPTYTPPVSPISPNTPVTNVAPGTFIGGAPDSGFIDYTSADQRTPWVAGLGSDRQYIYWKAKHLTSSYCSNVRPQINSFWVRSITLADKVTRAVDHISLRPGEVASYEILMPSNAAGRVANVLTEEDTVARGAGWVFSLSENPCDFAPAHNKCYSEDRGVSGGLTFKIIGAGSQSSKPVVCEVIEGKKYFLNVKNPASNTNPAIDTCQEALNYWTNLKFNCGGLVKFSMYN